MVRLSTYVAYAGAAAGGYATHRAIIVYKLPVRGFNRYAGAIAAGAVVGYSVTFVVMRKVDEMQLDM